jgi:hypothetical protein
MKNILSDHEFDCRNDRRRHYSDLHLDARGDLVGVSKDNCMREIRIPSPCGIEFRPFTRNYPWLCGLRFIKRWYFCSHCGESKRQPVAEALEATGRLFSGKGALYNASPSPKTE